MESFIWMSRDEKVIYKEWKVNYMPAVSIIVPVYNTEMYLEECLSSICTQTLTDIEIICIDDGSTDRSGVIMDQFAEKDSRIKVIHKDNTGYGHSMNVGIDAASGAYIGIVESDDWIAKEMMQTLYEAAFMYRTDFVKADFYRFTVQKNGYIRKTYNHLAWKDQYYNRVLHPLDEVETFKFIMNIWSGIYNTAFIKKNKIRFNETPGASFQDNGFWFQTFTLAERAVFLDKPLYMNRRDNPLSSVHCQDKVYTSCEEYDYIRQWVKQLPEKQKCHEYLCSEGRIRNYFFTIDRIGDNFKEDFFIRFREDYLKLLENGEIAETLLPADWKARIDEIIKNPKEACYMELMLRNRYLEIISPFKDIIIYGAGSYGRKAWSALNRIGESKRIAYFAVTDTTRNPSELFGIPVVEFDKLPEEFRQEALVIAAVKQEFHDQIVQKIVGRGYRHYTDSMIFFE